MYRCLSFLQRASSHGPPSRTKVPYALGVAAAPWKAIGSKKGDIAMEVRTKKKNVRTMCVQFEPLLDAREAWAKK